MFFLRFVFFNEISIAVSTPYVFQACRLIVIYLLLVDQNLFLSESLPPKNNRPPSQPAANRFAQDHVTFAKAALFIRL